MSKRNFGERKREKERERRGRRDTVYIIRISSWPPKANEWREVEKRWRE